MKTILAVAVLLASTWSGTMIKAPQLKISAELPGSALKWIHIAEVEFDRNNLDLDKYRVSVVEEEQSVVVILTGMRQPKNAVGSVGPDIGYEVEISKKDRKVLRSHFVR